MPSAPQISPCGMTPKPHPLDAAARAACARVGMDVLPVVLPAAAQLQDPSFAAHV